MGRLSQALLLLLLSFSLAQTDPLQREIRCPKGAKPHSRPYMAVLLDSQNHPICGGFLVGQQWVMTSARCKNFYKVVLGAHELKSGGVTYRVARYYRHPKFTFNNTTFSNDILLLKLRSKVRLSRNVDILRLATSSSVLSEGTLCSVAGWGLNQNYCENKLYEAYVNIYNRSKCQEFYPKIDYGKICAGNRESSQDFDQGEKGDPLVCNGVAHGILSYRNPCPPAVYTQISKYYQWIKETMAK